MTKDEVIQLCKNKNWKELRSFLTSNVDDLSFKILVTALFQTYLPDDKEYNLSVWDGSLRPNLVPKMDIIINGAVCLIDMGAAYLLAKKPEYLGDASVAANIRDYVQKNKNVLGHLLKNPTLPKVIQEIFKNDFGDLTPNSTFTLPTKKPIGNSLFDSVMAGESNFAASLSLPVPGDKNSDSINLEEQISSLKLI